MDTFDNFFNKKAIEPEIENEEQLNEDDVQEEPNVWEYTSALIEQAETLDASILAWMIGERVRKEVLFITDAEKGTEILQAFGQRLQDQFNQPYSYDYLLDCITLAEAYPDMLHFNDLSEDLTYDQLLMIAKLHDDLARTYYSELARFEKWDEQTLRRKIGQKTFENEFKKEND